MKAAKIAIALTLSTACLAASATPTPFQEPEKAPARVDPAEKEIRASVDAFVKAYNDGDAKAIADTFAEDAEVRTEDGSSVTGRPAILDHFAGVFADNPGSRIKIEVLAIRSLTADAALEEGKAFVTHEGRSDAETTLYEAIHVRKDGKWLQARVRDFAETVVSPHDRLKPLEWLLGDWVDEGHDGVVHSNCKWSEDGQFLIREFHLSIRGRREQTVTQRLGWDPVSEQIKGWTFDTTGGHGEQYWSRSGPEKWVIKSEGVTPEGRRATSTNILDHTTKDAATWASIDRTLGGEALEDTEVVTLVRRPPPPK